MGFNAKAFAAAFMEDQSRQINTRVAEAREYKRELKENAEESKSKIDKLAQLGNLAKSEIARLRALGFEDKHINPAIASGPKGLFELSKSAQEEAARRNFRAGQKFDEYEIESLIDYSEDFAYSDTRAEDFYEMNTALSKPSLASTQAPERGLVKTLFGIDLDDTVRERLDKDAYYDGYSVMDINEISKQETYDSVAPGTYFSFTPTEDFSPSRAAESYLLTSQRVDKVIANRKDNGKYIVDGASSLELEEADRKKELFNQIKILTRGNPTYLDTMKDVIGDDISQEDMAELEYGNLEGDNLERKLVKDLLESNPSIKQDAENKFSIIDGNKKYEIIIGSDQSVVSIMANGIAAEPDMIDEYLAQFAKRGLIPNARLADDTSIEPEEVPTTDSLNLENTFYNEDGKRVTGVPPRPDRSLSTVFLGGGMGSEDRDDILAGRMAIPKNLRPNQWDELFGETHDPETGSRLGEEPKATAPESKVEEENTRSNPYSFPESMSNADKNKAYDNLPSGAFYIHPVTNKLSQKK